MKLIWIMGSDNLFNFSKWYKAQKISNLIPFAVLTEGAAHLDQLIQREHMFWVNE